MDKKEFERIKEQAKQYTTAIVLPPNDKWLEVPCTQKLSMLQTTPESMIKKRKVGSTVIPYVSIDYVERALNFVSNFNRGIRIVDKWIKEYTKTTNNWKELKVYDAWVQCDCYIVLWDVKIERSVFGTRQMYENPAVSDFVVYESARSQATKSFADTLGIGSDSIRVENQKIEEARKKILEWGYTDTDVLDWFDTNGNNNL